VEGIRRFIEFVVPLGDLVPGQVVSEEAVVGVTLRSNGNAGSEAKAEAEAEQNHRRA
jgi:hypothetical protein